MDSVKRLDRQEMERRCELLKELWDDAGARLKVYGSNPAIEKYLIAVEILAKGAYHEALKELEAYREEERVK